MNKEQLLKQAKRAVAEVDVPELGTKLRLTSLSASKALELSDLNEEKLKGVAGTERRMMLLLVQSAIIDQDNKAIFEGDPSAATTFLDSVSIETMDILMKATPGFMPKAKETPAAGKGPSKGSAEPVAG